MKQQVNDINSTLAGLLSELQSLRKTVDSLYVENRSLNRNVDKLLKENRELRKRLEKYEKPPKDSGNRTVVWSSSDEAVATVDQSGLIEAVAPGTATVTATSADGTAISDYCQVNVEHGSAIVSPETAGQEVSVTVDGRDIIVDGVSADDLVRVVNSSGLMVYSGRGTRVGELSAGFHLVIVGARAYKVILR